MKTEGEGSRDGVGPDEPVFSVLASASARALSFGGRSG